MKRYIKVFLPALPFLILAVVCYACSKAVLAFPGIPKPFVDGEFMNALFSTEWQLVAVICLHVGSTILLFGFYRAFSSKYEEMESKVALLAEMGYSTEKIQAELEHRKTQGELLYDGLNSYSSAKLKALLRVAKSKADQGQQVVTLRDARP